jgi:hypothetical protein
VRERRSRTTTLGTFSSREFVGTRETEADVRKLIVQEWITLDGVIRAPGMKDEDRSGGFEHGERLFPEDGALNQLKLVDSEATETGAILATYEAAKA